MEVGDVGRPEIFGAGALLLDPVGDGGEDLPADVSISRDPWSSEWRTAAMLGRGPSGEDVPGVSLLDDAGVVRALVITGEGVGVLREGGETDEEHGGKQQRALDHDASVLGFASPSRAYISQGLCCCLEIRIEFV